MKNNYKTRQKVGDYIIYCDICGMPCWASQAYKLDKYTGRGGLLVCPVDRDVIDYGLVPYKVAAEKPIPQARINQTDTTTGREPPNLNTFDPLSGDLS